MHAFYYSRLLAYLAEGRHWMGNVLVVAAVQRASGVVVPLSLREDKWGKKYP